MRRIPKTKDASELKAKIHLDRKSKENMLRQAKNFRVHKERNCCHIILITSKDVKRQTMGLIRITSTT